MGSRARLRASVLNISKYYLEGEKMGKLIRSTSQSSFLQTLLLNAAHGWETQCLFANICAKALGHMWQDQENRGHDCETGGHRATWGQVWPSWHCGLRREGRCCMPGARRSIRAGVALPNARMLTERLNDTEAGPSHGQEQSSPPKGRGHRLADAASAAHGPAGLQKERRRAVPGPGRKVTGGQAPGLPT